MVSTAADLTAAIKADGPRVVRVQGMITLAAGMYDVSSDKTIIGIGAASGITGGGFNIGVPISAVTSPPANAVHNVIIRNLVFRNASDDSINVQSSTTNVWIDHNDLASGYDGLIDIKRGSDFITVSWNRLHNHDKSMLLGHSDDNAAEDNGHLRVTYVHNWFEGTGQRHPRVRFANPVHVLNNYYSNIGSYGVASTENAGVYVERNYFENVANPTVTQTGDSDSGNLKVLNNYKVNSGTEQVRNGASVAAIPYSYTPEANSSVKATVTAGAGTGKI
jgi:pectate lyase